MSCSARQLYPFTARHLYRTFNINQYILSSFQQAEESNFVKQNFQQIIVTSLPFEQNTYIASFAGSNECVVIDPGFEPAKILKQLDDHRLTPTAMLITHGHYDHIGGNAVLKQRWPHCQIAIGAPDATKLSNPQENLSGIFGAPLTSPPADVILNDGDTYEAAGFVLSVRMIPGHSIGHVAYIWEGQKPVIAWVGDIIFANSVGRTDFPDGNMHQLITGIRSKLFPLPDDTIMYPGHGPATTVGREKSHNPFVGLETS
jgi:hydroxyacylglutathione hydrolase